MWVWFLGQEDPLEEGMATHSSILAWEIPWTEEPGRLQSIGSQRVRHYWAHTHTHTRTDTHTCTHGLSQLDFPASALRDPTRALGIHPKKMSGPTQVRKTFCAVWFVSAKPGKQPRDLTMEEASAFSCEATETAYMWPAEWPDIVLRKYWSLMKKGKTDLWLSFATVYDSSVQFSHSVVSDSLRPHELQHARLPCPSPTPRACSNSCPLLSQWCHPTISSSVVPFLPPSIFPSIRVFSNESVLHIRWPKDWSVSFSISPSNEYSGLISFRIDWFDLLAVQGTLKSLLQPRFKSISSSALSFLYGPTLTSMEKP